MESSDLKVTSLSLALPYDGVDHAGGQLLLHHHRVLLKHCVRLDVFSPDYDHNRPQTGRNFQLDDHHHPAIISFPWWRKTLIGKVLARLWTLAMPVLPDLGACIGFITSRRLRESIRNADVVELQWAEFFIFARLVHRLNPSATIIGYVHDVPSQRIERAVATWRGPLRRVYLRYVTAQERQLVRGLHAAIVLSQKDADLLSARGVNFDVHVLNPPLKTRSDSVTAKPGPTRTSHTQAFGFVAAFHRPENNDAGLWLLNHIWPHVVDEVPAAHLYLVGSRPSKELRDAAENIGESVEVTGYVDDIDSFYEHFDTVIIPLRYGAGVKIKTISGILAQKNVIATPIAIEGTLPDHFFYCVSDAPDVLADAMVNVARRPEGGRSIVAAALAEVGARYSIEDYSDAMLAVYDVRRCHSQVDNGAPVRWRVSNSLRITSPQVQASAASAHE